MQQSVFILAISSDIGIWYAENMLRRGWLVSGTYRTYAPKLEHLEKQGVKLFKCDVLVKSDIEELKTTYKSQHLKWDILMLATGIVSPVGSFLDCNFDEWERSIRANFMNVMRFCHEFLQFRTSNLAHGPLVIFFSGSGSNSAPINYSAYTLSKIALTKACELLSAEINDCRFTIVGPGVIDTKIHQPTIDFAQESGGAYDLLTQRIRDNQCTSVNNLIDFLNWLEEAPSNIIGGRNFSVVYDKWIEKDFTSFLESNPNIYKLRRYGNDFAIDNGKVK